MPDFAVNMSMTPIMLAAAGSATWGMLAGTVVAVARSRRRWERDVFAATRAALRARLLRGPIARIIASNGVLANFF
jgi:hypothetical protein